MARPQSAFHHQIRVSWGDCDPANIVYTARLPWFALDAINAWWEDNFHGNGWYQMELDQNVGTPFVHMSMNFTAPVTPRHKLACYVWPVRLGNSSVEFRVEAEQDGKVCFSGNFVSVFTDAQKFQKRSPPDEICEYLERCINLVAD